MLNMQQNQLRPDLQVIAGLVPEGSKVLDVGCGDGELLAWLSKHKRVDGRGLEIDQQRANDALAKGLAVIQGDAERDLHDYPDQSHDIVILSRALQAMRDPVEMLQHMIRIGKQAIVSIPNFGYWPNRTYLAFKGRMPVTQTLRYEWYNTPNIHFCTLADFSILCREKHISISERICLASSGKRLMTQHGALANLFAEQAIFMLEK